MIEEIEIRDLGVIQHARLTPGPGFTAITGETGAGKTMLLTGLDLLLGGRGDSALVRNGADRAQVDGRFAGVAEGVRTRVTEAGGELDDDGALLLGRNLAPQGRSRAYLGGRSVPATVLAELAESLVTVHGQSDQISLRSSARQRELLDDYAAALDPHHRDLLERMRQAHGRVRELESALAQARSSLRTRDLEVSSLSGALAEIDAADIEVGEDQALREEADRLDHLEAILAASLAARAALTGDEGMPGAVTLIEQAARALDKVSGVDAELAVVARGLTAAAVTAADLDTEIGHHLAALEADPDRLDAVHARRATLAALARRFGMAFAEPSESDPPPGSSDAVLAWAQGARERLAELTGPSYDVAELERQLDQAREARDAVVVAITQARRMAGVGLAEDVAIELAQLAMPHATMSVEVSEAAPGPTGADAVTLTLQAHPGATARPLGQGASGGELSRIMLALEVVLARRRPTGGSTFVFDEVDAGIGGRTASHVGARLASLAASSQVLVVTHLAQVAAFADTQIVVEKDSSDPNGVITTVRTVTGEDRVAELARMLSGEVTATALEHAADLLERAGVGR